jgi:glycosyltransferase involved in cell wall biosynthesis
VKLSILLPVYNQQELVIRALESLPIRDDIEVIVIDDCSTDDTFRNLVKYKKDHQNLNITLLRNEVNLGIGLTKNRGYDIATGEYIGLLDSDDYVYTEEYDRAIDEIDGSDIVFIDAEKNDGSRFHLNPNNQRHICAGWARFIKRDFLYDSRCPNVRAGEDWYLNEKLTKKNPTTKYTGIVAYHYNFPREGSLYDLVQKGILKGIEEINNGKQ